jgi:ribosomal protein L10
MKVEVKCKLIEKSNEAFTKMSDAEKRVEVAKNTLARIAIKQLVGYHWCDNRRWIH